MKMSTWGKILLLMILIMLVYLIHKHMLKSTGTIKEGFEQNDSFLFKTSAKDVYDGFYANIYDSLVYNNLKDDYEIGEIVNKTSPSSESVILDVGSGTGHHVAKLADTGLNVLGIDISPAMVEKAKENYPQYKFEVADALNSGEFPPSTFTHVLCLYFTIYYFQDKVQFFRNCMKWLMPGGYLVVHLVDPERFDPILPAGNPLMLVSPQKYAPERITSTKVKFEGFTYSADFKHKSSKKGGDDVAVFTEKFRGDKGDSANKTRKQEHRMYMPSVEDIVNDAQQVGFNLQGKVDMVHAQYEYQYLYIFTKT